jgi:hypothetical protein
MYSYNKAVDILCKKMEYDDAIEFLEFNTLSITGKYMPIWVRDDMF